MDKVINLSGRLFLGVLFLVAGLGKISGYEATQAYMAMMGVPGALLPAVIVLEVGGALALMLGWRIRLTAVALAGFSILSGIIFHADFADQMQMTMLLKNIAIAGGLLVLATQHVTECISLDAWLARNKQRVDAQLGSIA